MATGRHCDGAAGLLRPTGRRGVVRAAPVWAERGQVGDLFRRNGVVYVCGDGRQMAPAVRETLVRIYQEASGASDSEAQRWVDVIEHERGRYVSDVFA